MQQQKISCEILHNEQVRVLPAGRSVYNTLIKNQRKKNTEFHTYKPKQERCFRVVLKNIHPSTDLNDIKQSLTGIGYVVKDSWTVKQRVTNKPLPMHFLDIKTHDNNKDIYKILTLLNTIVQFEAPQAKREIPPRMHCQKFGHKKTIAETPQDA